MATLKKYGPSILTAQKIGANGKAGDQLRVIVIAPQTKLPAAVIIYDGDPTAVGAVDGTDYISFTVYAGSPSGSLSIPDLSPITIDFGGVNSRHGGWFITTGANVQVFVVGEFNES